MYFSQIISILQLHKNISEFSLKVENESPDSRSTQKFAKVLLNSFIKKSKYNKKYYIFSIVVENLDPVDYAAYKGAFR